MRKKVKRVTGELEVMQTYFETFALMIKAPQAQKVLSSLQGCIDYMKELFSEGQMSVGQGKKV